MRYVVLSFLVLAGCSDAPDLPGGTNPALERADYPTLAPVEQILGPAQPDPVADQRVADGLDARVAALRARADALRASRIGPTTRKRMEDGVARP